MVCDTEKPSLRAASCCSVEVVNGGAGTLQRLLRNVGYAELGVLTLLEECDCVVVCREALVELGLHLRLRSVGVSDSEDGVDAVVGLALELLNLAFALYDEAHGYRLHASGRKRRLHLAPQHGRELEAHDAVEHAACLLGVHEVHVQMARVLDSGENCRLRDFVEYDAVGRRLVQSEHFAKVP